MTQYQEKWHDVAWALAQRYEHESFRHLGIPAKQEYIDAEASILICDVEAAWEEEHRTDDSPADLRARTQKP